MTTVGKTQTAIQSKHGKFQKACYVCMSQEFTTLTLMPILKGTHGHLLFANEKTEAKVGRARRVATVSAELLDPFTACRRNAQSTQGSGHRSAGGRAIEILPSTAGSS